MGPIEFWALTVRETLMTMEATMWRIDLGAARDLSQAWHTAALTRAKPFPPLKQLLMRFMPSKAKKLPMAERRREFREMTAGMGPQLQHAVESLRNKQSE